MIRYFGLMVAAGLLFGCSDPSSQDAQVLEVESKAALEIGDSTSIVNAHMHAAFLAMDDAAYRERVLQEMDAQNITRSVLHMNEESDIEDWVDAAPGRFLAGPSFPCWQNEDGTSSCNWNGENWPDLDWMRENYRAGKMQIMGEMFFVYTGVAPNDPRMDPYWALAAELDIPVAVHVNRGPPPDSPVRPPGCCPNFDPELGNPALLRPILEQYPDLKIWIQHAGFPALPMLDNIDYLEETFALLEDYPNIYVDMTALNAAVPAPIHAAAVEDFLNRGFGDRIMMGTDNWPAEQVIARYESFEFLSDSQRRDILHDNAARFFDLN